MDKENNLEKLLSEFLALQKNFKEDIFFEYDSNLDNSFLNEISHKLKIKCFKSSFSFYKKKDNLRRKIASAGRKKYFRLFNELKISKYVIDKSLGKKTSLY